jgi:foldase protein PrsA
MKQAMSESIRRCSREVVRGATILCAVSGLAVCLTACAQGGQGPTVVRVGRWTIGRAEIEHWERVIARGAAPVALGPAHAGATKEAALDFLIRAEWLIGQAKEDGMPVSKRAVDREIHGRIEVDGEEFRSRLRSAGKTIADTKLEIEAELAAGSIDSELTTRAADITPQQVLVVYRRNPSRFRLAELRLTDLFEQLPSRAAAASLARRMSSKASFVRHATNHELLFWMPVSLPERAAVLRAIFAARPGVVNGPMKFQGKWTVFSIRQIIPPRPLSFAMARAKVAAALIAGRQRRFTAAYLDAYRTRWRAKTSCRRGYVVQGCREYAGPLRHEPDPFSAG